MKNQIIALFAAAFLISCNSQSSIKQKSSTENSETSAKVDSSNVAHEADVPASSKMADAATIMARKQVPILCYHHIKDIDVLPKNSLGYTVTVNQFKAQMKTLADSGFHSITPDQLYKYLVYGAALPSKPVMLTFDDTDEEQFSIAKPEMDKYGFKAVYFIMTVSINKPRYMTKDQIKQLSDEGHVIACHTWDHHRTDRYVLADWEIQLDKPKKQLEQITGKQIDYFAYPFGVWSATGFPELKKRGFKIAFQLATKRDPENPLYTVRRVIVGPQWKDAGLTRVLKAAFQ
ncbi:MAG: polysaccharide deacetylase family protein [Flavisolibacter sp.]